MAGNEPAGTAEPEKDGLLQDTSQWDSEGSHCLLLRSNPLLATLLPTASFTSYEKSCFIKVHILSRDIRETALHQTPTVVEKNIMV